MWDQESTGRLLRLHLDPPLNNLCPPTLPRTSQLSSGGPVPKASANFSRFGTQADALRGWLRISEHTREAMPRPLATDTVPLLPGSG